MIVILISPVCISYFETYAVKNPDINNFVMQTCACPYMLNFPPAFFAIIQIANCRQYNIYGSVNIKMGSLCTASKCITFTCWWERIYLPPRTSTFFFFFPRPVSQRHAVLFTVLKKEKRLCLVYAWSLHWQSLRECASTYAAAVVCALVYGDRFHNSCKLSGFVSALHEPAWTWTQTLFFFLFETLWTS